MPSKLAVQTYTIRDFLKTEADLRDSMRKVRDIGYEAVQLSGVGCMNGDAPEVTAAKAREILDEQGLACIATHRNWAPLLADTEAEIAFHKTLGCDYVAIGGLPGEYFADAAGAKRFLDEAERVLPRLRRQAPSRFRSPRTCGSLNLWTGSKPSVPARGPR